MTDIALIHASPAAIAPVQQYYARHAPDLRITNLLDDGLLRLFREAAQRDAASLDTVHPAPPDAAHVHPPSFNPTPPAAALQSRDREGALVRQQAAQPGEPTRPRECDFRVTGEAPALPPRPNPAAEQAERRLANLIRTAYDEYQARAAVITCSSLLPPMVRRLQQTSPIPLFKIDQPMADIAVRATKRVGFVCTFAPTVEPTRSLLLEAAQAAGSDAIEIVPHIAEGAYQALLDGRTAEHDALLTAAIHHLAATQNPGIIVLAQVSMARVLPVASLDIPVITALETSLAHLRNILK